MAIELAVIELAVIELVVGDMAASLAFYRTLGLAAPDGSDSEEHVEVALPGGLKVAFDTVATIRSIDPGWAPPSGGHRIALAFRCADPAGVDATYAEVTGAGHAGHLAPFDAFWGQRYAVVVDPDGNHIDLFAPIE
jgi:catechol 2,3-dioxygenase-like lactoylglutathione lyase family enzyme